MRRPGYGITFNGVHDGRERWSVWCECGWWDHRRITRKTAEGALDQHWMTCPKVRGPRVVA